MTHGRSWKGKRCKRSIPRDLVREPEGRNMYTDLDHRRPKVLFRRFGRDSAREMPLNRLAGP